MPSGPARAVLQGLGLDKGGGKGKRRSPKREGSDSAPSAPARRQRTRRTFFAVVSCRLLAATCSCLVSRGAALSDLLAEGAVPPGLVWLRGPSLKPLLAALAAVTVSRPDCSRSTWWSFVFLALRPGCFCLWGFGLQLLGRLCGFPSVSVCLFVSLLSPLFQLC